MADERTLTVDEAVSAIANYCRVMREKGREPLFSDLPRVLGLRAAVIAERPEVRACLLSSGGEG